jgi:excisionase family DNA binding protein
VTRQVPTSPTNGPAAGAVAQPPRLLLTALEAAQALRISERKLWDLTAPRGPIRVVRLGRSVRYPVDELRRWIEAEAAGQGGREDPR